jgi:Arc/MetJ family transcription regulator
VAKTLIDIDDELLFEAQRILGADTKKATVNAALREVVRWEAAAIFLEIARAGVFGTVQKNEKQC